jgi:hypothetical protein
MKKLNVTSLLNRSGKDAYATVAPSPRCGATAASPRASIAKPPNAATKIVVSGAIVIDAVAVSAAFGVGACCADGE